MCCFELFEGAKRVRQSSCAGFRGGLRSANTRSGFPPPSLKARAQRLLPTCFTCQLLAARNSLTGPFGQLGDNEYQTHVGSQE